MSYIYLESNIDNLESYIFIEVDNIESSKFYPSFFYTQHILDEYRNGDYKLVLSKKYYNLKNIDNELEQTKYYLCKKGKFFGFKKPNNIFIQLFDYDSSWMIKAEDILRYNVKIKLCDLLLNQNGLMKITQ